MIGHVAAIGAERTAVAPDRCCCCKPVNWRVPGGVTFADGTAAHLSCYEMADMAPFRAATGDVPVEVAPLAGCVEESCARTSSSPDRPLTRGQVYSIYPDAVE